MTPDPRQPGSDPEGVPLPLSCGSYRLGHEAHYIQAFLSYERPQMPGRLLTIGDDGWIGIETDDGLLRRWTHDPARLRAIIDRHGADVEVRNPGLIGVPHIDPVDRHPRKYVISIDTEQTPCPGHPDDKNAPLTTADLVDQVLDRGGFVVRGQDLDLP